MIEVVCGRLGCFIYSLTFYWTTSACKELWDFSVAHPLWRNCVVWSEGPIVFLRSANNLQ